MHLADVQDYAQARLLADAVLAAFGPPLVYTPFTADEDARAAIATRLREAGVCIEIGSVEAEGPKEQPNPRYTRLDASFEVFVAEAPKVAHTPEQMALVTRVVNALQVRVSVGEQNIRVVGYGAAVAESGYVLHVLTCTVPVLL